MCMALYGCKNFVLGLDEGIFVFSNPFAYFSVSQWLILSHVYATDKNLRIFWSNNMSNDEILDVPGTVFPTVPGSQY